jgi:hypothetical protein
MDAATAAVSEFIGNDGLGVDRLEVLGSNIIGNAHGGVHIAGHEFRIVNNQFSGNGCQNTPSVTGSGTLANNFCSDGLVNSNGFGGGILVDRLYGTSSGGHIEGNELDHN